MVLFFTASNCFHFCLCIVFIATTAAKTAAAAVVRDIISRSGCASGFVVCIRGSMWGIIAVFDAIFSISFVNFNQHSSGICKYFVSTPQTVYTQKRRLIYGNSDKRINKNNYSKQPNSVY